MIKGDGQLVVVQNEQAKDVSTGRIGCVAGRCTMRMPLQLCCYVLFLLHIQVANSIKVMS